VSKVLASCAAIAATALGAAVAFAQNPAPARPMSFFISSAAPPSGNLGGLEGADKICQDLATGAGAGNRTWHAYLSTQPAGGTLGVDARSRIGTGPWYNAKGAMIAADVADLHGDVQRDRNNIQMATALTETGIPYISPTAANLHDILTGSDSLGRAFPAGIDTTCNNWTSDTDAFHAIVAHADRTGPNTSWNSTHLSRGCSKEILRMNGYSGHLYCFAIN